MNDFIVSFLLTAYKSQQTNINLEVKICFANRGFFLPLNNGMHFSFTVKLFSIA